MKIICVGRNYAEHAAELGDDPPAEPLLFGKFDNTLIGPGKREARAKGFDTFCPLGDRLVPVLELGDGSGLRVVQRLNGEVLQDGSTDDLIFAVPFLLSYVSAVFTLEPGDLILTGTPPGVGWARDPKVSLADGDVVEVEVEGIGVLGNPVVRKATLGPGSTLGRGQTRV